MSDNDTENIDSTNDTTEEVEKTDEVEETDDQSGNEDLEALREKNKRLFERTKKAEAEAKLLKAERLKKEEQAKAETGKPADTSKKQDVVLTPMDAILLSKANITEADDIEEVVKFANYVGKPVKDVLKDKTMQTILRTRQEERQTAEATHTGGARRGSSKVSDEQIMANVADGKLPDDPEALAKARHASKFKK